MQDHQDYMVAENMLLLEQAMAALEKTTGIEGRLMAMEPVIGPERRADATVELKMEGERHKYVVEIKRVDRFAAIGQVKNQLESFMMPGLLVAPRITAETADKCREFGLQFIDAHGNAFLQAPGFFVLVKGQHLKAGKEFEIAKTEAKRGGTATALKVIFALLCQPNLLNAPYRDIKDAAGVALGAIGWVFFDLNNRGFTAGGNKAGNRHILERKRLINEWVTNYPIKLRPKLKPKRFHAQDPNWWRHTDINEYGAQWGGEVAGDKLTGYLKPNEVTIYMRPDKMRENMGRMVKDHKLRADPRGDIEVLEAFWNCDAEEQEIDVVPPLLVYADLMASMDPRNFETAKMIYEKNINGIDA